MINEFKYFLLQSKVVDLAVAVVIGAAFGSAVNALVSDLITPLIAAFIKVPDFSNIVFTINGSKFMLGHFINAFVSFALVAMAVFFFVVRPMNIFAARARGDEPTNLAKKKCPECASEISANAKRCPYCTQPVV